MKKFTIGLVGNPNSGKTTLFNSLTGSHQRVGNWPGVTVDKKTGYFEFLGHHIEIVDLPGIYSLSVLSKETAIDERIAAEYLLFSDTDVIVNVLDANNLERNLYLTTQLLELQIPVILAVNMTDIAKNRGIHLDLEQLSKELNCKTIGLVANRKQGIAELKTAIIDACNKPHEKYRPIDYPTNLSSAIENIRTQLTNSVKNPEHAYFMAVRLLEDDILLQSSPQILESIKQHKEQIQKELNEDTDIIIADSRYGKINAIIANVIEQTSVMKTTVTAAIDRIILNRILGIPLFLLIMYFMFLFAINIGGAFQDFFNITSNAVFVDLPTLLLVKLHSPVWLNSIIAFGVGKGISTTLTFIPVIGAMFLFLAFLESSGYMARAAFVVDRLMSAIGLPGKSFVPMIIGFGCNVPAIMAARTLENKKDRILTVMMSPFMSCGARLAIYTVFTAAFFPKGGQNIVFILYLVGIVIAVITGMILRKTLLKGEHSNLIMELPPYHMPTLSNILTNAWHRLNSFICKAGKVIIPVCLIIGALNSIQINTQVNSAQPSNHHKSLLTSVGQAATPAFSPMGVHRDNWPATVGLITGILAKEVVVGTLNTLYAQANNSASTSKKTSFSLIKDLHKAATSIPNNLSSLFAGLSNPISASAPEQTLNQNIYGQMYSRFSGQVNAFAYLLFVLLYLPCIATVAAIYRELNWKWAVFSVFWTTGIAYCTAVFFYQTATLHKHPGTSTAWIAGIVIAFFATVFAMKKATARSP